MAQRYRSLRGLRTVRDESESHEQFQQESENQSHEIGSSIGTQHPQQRLNDQSVEMIGNTFSLYIII